MIPSVGDQHLQGKPNPEVVFWGVTKNKAGIRLGIQQGSNVTPVSILANVEHLGQMICHGDKYSHPRVGG